jgi:hypothetical protein
MPSDTSPSANTASTELARRSSESLVALSWVDCKRPEIPYFLLEVWVEGTYRYVGNFGVRELGSREGVLSKQQLRSLLKTTGDFGRVRAGKASSAPDNPGGEELSGQFCLSVQERARSDAAPLVARFASDAAVQFNDQVDAVTYFRRLVCPGRAFNVYDNPGACDAANALMAYEESGDCRVIHAVYVYESGIVHYYASGVPDTDQYAVVSRPVARQLVKIAKGYTITGSEGLDGDIQRPLRGTETELAEFRSKVSSYAKISFIAPKAGDARCLPRLEQAQLKRWITF